MSAASRSSDRRSEYHITEMCDMKLTDSPQPTVVEPEEEGFPSGMKLVELGHDGLSDFTSTEFKQHTTIR